MHSGLLSLFSRWFKFSGNENNDDVYFEDITDEDLNNTTDDHLDVDSDDIVDNTETTDVVNIVKVTDKDSSQDTAETEFRFSKVPFEEGDDSLDEDEIKKKSDNTITPKRSSHSDNDISSDPIKVVDDLNNPDQKQETTVTNTKLKTPDVETAVSEPQHETAVTSDDDNSLLTPICVMFAIVFLIFFLGMIRTFVFKKKTTKNGDTLRIRSPESRRSASRQNKVYDEVKSPVSRLSPLIELIEPSPPMISNKRKLIEPSPHLLSPNKMLLNNSLAKSGFSEQRTSLPEAGREPRVIASVESLDDVYSMVSNKIEDGVNTNKKEGGRVINKNEGGLNPNKSKGGEVSDMIKDGGYGMDSNNDEDGVYNSSVVSNNSEDNVYGMDKKYLSVGSRHSRTSSREKRRIHFNPFEEYSD